MFMIVSLTIFFYLWYNMTRDSYEHEVIFTHDNNDRKVMKMPTDTFFNLPVEKRERIIEAAIDEFSRYSFHKARVTAIADNAGIAKGSFYQYFEDKKDLYKYLMEIIAEKKLSYINKDMLMNREKYGFFQLLREVFLSGIRFAKENPRLVPIGEMLVADKDLLSELYGEHRYLSSDFFKELLEFGREKGEIDPDADLDFLARMLSGLIYSLVDLVMEDGKIDMDDMEIYDKMLYFVENGIKKR
ncbi:MAG TPA: TetR/AcrR family transcriptional regulator [Halanaerobiales bacterium]|nr:TetR/AcrR family transcriptional regulator [Halanaerobiales bacterium]HPZ62257.1 TetR/AcrR family transcriptional regulator [Halanaerobiales bacterium]HQD03587.1 TetR/AcrR family transcriptional regulator [Halanaerobiales bacterium]